MGQTKASTIGRREVLRGTLTAAAALLTRRAFGQQKSRPADRRPPFVLVHGSWHGGWCWRRCRDLLVQSGYSVLTPTLTGLGDRYHLTSPAVDLDTHIRDVVEMLEFEDARDVVSVGHSYAGLVVSGVAEKASSRIRSVIYLDALNPDDGRRRPP